MGGINLTIGLGVLALLMLFFAMVANRLGKEQEAEMKKREMARK